MQSLFAVNLLNFCKYVSCYDWVKMDNRNRFFFSTFSVILTKLTVLIELQVLQQTLPSQVFTLLIQRMREYGNKAAAAEESTPRNTITEDIDDDLE